jgi:hypothetical protein
MHLLVFEKKCFQQNISKNLKNVPPKYSVFRFGIPSFKYKHIFGDKNILGKKYINEKTKQKIHILTPASLLLVEKKNTPVIYHNICNNQFSNIS